jgi:hypothetical protein
MLAIAMKYIEGLIEWNKVVQQDSNYGTFVNQNIMGCQLSKTVLGHVSFFHP